MIVGGEGPNIEIHSISERKLLTQFKAHEKRVKAATTTNLNGLEELHLVTVSNDGFIKLWKIQVRIFLELNCYCDAITNSKKCVRKSIKSLF